MKFEATNDSIIQLSPIIKRAGGEHIDALHYQKIAYFTYMIYLGEYRQQLFKEGFQAWKNGPVQPILYHLVKNDAIRDDKTLDDKKKIEFISDFSLSLSKVSSFRLVKWSHEAGSAWEKNYQEGIKFIDIPLIDIYNEYKNNGENLLIKINEAVDDYMDKQFAKKYKAGEYKTA